MAKQVTAPTEFWGKKSIEMPRPKGPVPPVVPKDKLPRNAFDAWLERGLHQLYDKVANEPIPEELLRLIEGDRKK